MPTLSQWMIKAGMFYLVLALLVRGLVAFGGSWAVAFGPVWWHLLAIGWLTQVILAVAWWMFPTLPGKRRRGDARPMWASAIALNLGLALRTVGEPLLTVTDGLGVQLALWVGASLQAAAVIIAIVLLWPRVRPPKTRKEGA